MTGSYDLILRNARILDGSGAAAREGDLAVRGDRIERLGEVGEGAATRELDLAGLAVAPGFIDVHTHDDFAAVLHGGMEFKTLGGVTTCVVGNCGMGAAPHREASLMARVFHPAHSLPHWEGYAGYLAHLDEHPAAVNIGTLVGHGTLRMAAMGNDDRPPRADEMEQMQSLLREGIEAGALGLSTGLIYDPGRHASTDEIVELVQLLRGTGGLYTTHMRDEGAGLVGSVDEAIEIGERAGVPVQISHHKAAGRENWGLVHESLRRIEAAQARGIEVHADQYPYTAASTVLAAVLRPGTLRAAAAGGGLGLEPSDLVIASTARHPEWEGLSLAELATLLEQPVHEAGETVLAAEPTATVILHSMSEEDVRTVLAHPSTMIGSDGIPTLEGKPHPRLWGSFARVLGRYARELGVLSLEQAVHRMTGFPARKFRLRDRGELREGAIADLVVFDPARVLDRGTYQDPQQPPVGIAHVFVNGVPVVEDGKPTPARPGRTLRRAAV